MNNKEGSTTIIKFITTVIGTKDPDHEKIVRLFKEYRDNDPHGRIKDSEAIACLIDFTAGYKAKGKENKENAKDFDSYWGNRGEKWNGKLDIKQFSFEIWTSRQQEIDRKNKDIDLLKSREHNLLNQIELLKENLSDPEKLFFNDYIKYKNKWGELQKKIWWLEDIFLKAYSLYLSYKDKEK